jgi:hypothetical protein
MRRHTLRRIRFSSLGSVSYTWLADPSGFSPFSKRVRASNSREMAQGPSPGVGELRAEMERRSPAVLSYYDRPVQWSVPPPTPARRCHPLANGVTWLGAVSIAAIVFYGAKEALARRRTRAPASTSTSTSSPPATAALLAPPAAPAAPSVPATAVPTGVMRGCHVAARSRWPSSGLVRLIGYVSDSEPLSSGSSWVPASAIWYAIRLPGPNHYYAFRSIRTGQFLAGTDGLVVRLVAASPSTDDEDDGDGAGGVPAGAVWEAKEGKSSPSALRLQNHTDGKMLIVAGSDEITLDHLSVADIPFDGQPWRLQNAGSKTVEEVVIRYTIHPTGAIPRSGGHWVRLEGYDRQSRGEPEVLAVADESGAVSKRRCDNAEVHCIWEMIYDPAENAASFRSPASTLYLASSSSASGGPRLTARGQPQTPESLWIITAAAHS